MSAHALDEDVFNGLASVQANLREANLGERVLPESQDEPWLPGYGFATQRQTYTAVHAMALAERPDWPSDMIRSASRTIKSVRRTHQKTCGRMVQPQAFVTLMVVASGGAPNRSQNLKMLRSFLVFFSSDRQPFFFPRV